jgi:hypothetical protein
VITLGGSCELCGGQLAGIGTEARHAERGAAGSGGGAAVRHVHRCSARSCLSACTRNEGSRPVRPGLRASTRNERSRPVRPGLHASTRNDRACTIRSGLHACTGNGRACTIRSSDGARRRTFNATRRRRVGAGNRGKGQSCRSCASDQKSSHEFFPHCSRVPPVNLRKHLNSDDRTVGAVVRAAFGTRHGARRRSRRSPRSPRS